VSTFRNNSRDGDASLPGHLRAEVLYGQLQARLQTPQQLGKVGVLRDSRQQQSTQLLQLDEYSHTPESVTWSETVGHRTRPVWDQTNRSWSWSCKQDWRCRSGVVLWNTVLSRHHNYLERHSNFSSTIYSFSILCLEHHYCGDQQRAFTYLKVKSTKCFCLLPVVFVLLFWSWSCEQRSWSCYFGLGLKNLVLFTSLVLEGRRSQSCHCYRTNVSWYKTTISSYRSQNTVHSNSNQIWPFMSLSHTVHSAAIWQTWWN